MKAFFLLVWLLLTGATATLAQQTPTGIRPLDQLVAAINTKSVAPLQPLLQVGSKLAFRNQHTVFTDISHLNSKPGQAPVQSLVGYPFLSQYRTTIDFVNKQVRFYNW